MYKNLRPHAFNQKWPLSSYSVLYILIYLSHLHFVSSGRIQKQYHHQEHEDGELAKQLTEGMSIGDGAEGDLANKLFLSRLVVLGQYEKARSLALLDPEFSPAPSYSGFLCTNSTYNTNLFFWFFPAMYNQDDSPLVLWLNGAGSSSLFGLFAENGPFQVDSKGFLNARQHPWTLTHSMLYIDSPAGVGFSFTEDEDGYPTTQEGIADDLYVFLTQFFLIFPKFQGNDFYLAGQSYAGKYLPSLAMKIRDENEKTPAVNMNLKGLLLFSPYVDPILQASYGSLLYTIGLVDSKQKQLWDDVYENLKGYINSEDWIAAHTLMDESIYGDLTPYPTLFYNTTGFRNYLNYMRPTYPATYSNHRPFLRQNYVRNAIHVGNQKYHSFSKKVMRGLRKAFHQSGKRVLESLLESDYKVLIVAGQLDVAVNSNGVDRLVHELDWIGREELQLLDRTQWTVNSEIAGYIKATRNLAFVTMRNAGHTIPHDKPFWSYTLVNEFTSGLLLDERTEDRDPLTEDERKKFEERQQQKKAAKKEKKKNQSEGGKDSSSSSSSSNNNNNNNNGGSGSSSSSGGSGGSENSGSSSGVGTGTGNGGGEERKPEENVEKREKIEGTDEKRPEQNQNPSEIKQEQNQDVIKPEQQLLNEEKKPEGENVDIKQQEYQFQNQEPYSHVNEYHRQYLN